MAGRSLAWVRAVALASSGAIVPAAIAQTPARVWSLPAEPQWADAETLVLQGTERDGNFVPKSLSLPERETDSPGRPRLLPLTGELLPLLRPRIFGVEERVAATAEAGGLHIRCGAGSRPAGVVLEPTGYRFPRNMAGDLVLNGEASVPVGLSLVAPGGDAPAPPQTSFSGGRAALPLGPDASALVVSCPFSANEIIFRGARIEPAGGPAVRYGSWVWDAAEAIRNPAAFVDHLAALGLGDIAIQPPADPGDILPVARALSASGIAAHFVEGDPDMIEPDGLARALERVGRLRRAAQRLRSAHPPVRLELDIEPYGRADYGRDPTAAWRRWASAVEAIARSWGEPVDVDVPWWMLGAPGGVAALTSARASIDTIVVMAYRTEPQLILDAAEPWLALGMPVKIAVEAGEVATEVQRTYRRAPAGELVISDGRAVLQPAPVARARGAATFSLTRETRTRPDRVSFYGRDAERGAAERTILPFLKGWSNFRGFRVHGFSGLRSQIASRPADVPPKQQ
ncbi:hypothetical protein Q9Q95_03315 [Sphingomonas sp. DG1-23]|uniref:hypothetical protein n=1 Tax=Sphingomonas sp. DG1-23 TaxID=3068316 RepID=UPI00273EF50E|nr:hypothetical protein [Sphingomonas sp. DG1-23]MDP5277941.1 hypothetical protein [Sphingomonas sp. DG1-23]